MSTHFTVPLSKLTKLIQLMIDIISNIIFNKLNDIEVTLFLSELTFPY